MAADGNEPGGGGAAGKISGAALGIAVAVLLAWGAFIFFLVGRASPETTEVHWTRLAWLFSSVEAVVFAAAGAVFGTTIQRQRAERAEERAEANEKEAASGRALAEAILADEEAGASQEEPALQATGGAEARTRRASSGGEPGAQVAQRHARLARKLFPTRT